MSMIGVDVAPPKPPYIPWRFLTSFAAAALALAGALVLTRS